MPFQGRPYDEALADNDVAARLEMRIVKLERLLLDLTPGGSEFYGSPERCAQWAKDRMTMTGKLAAERNRLRIAADALAVVAHRAVAFLNNQGALREELITALRQYREAGK